MMQEISLFNPLSACTHPKRPCSHILSYFLLVCVVLIQRLVIWVDSIEHRKHKRDYWWLGSVIRIEPGIALNEILGRPVSKTRKLFYKQTLPRAFQSATRCPTETSPSPPAKIRKNNYIKVPTFLYVGPTGLDPNPNPGPERHLHTTFYKNNPAYHNPTTSFRPPHLDPCWTNSDTRQLLPHDNHINRSKQKKLTNNK